MILVLQTLSYFLVFIGLSFFVFYTLGFSFLRRSKEQLADQEILVLSFCLGIILFLIAAFSLGFLHLRFLMLPFLFGLSALVLFKFSKELLRPWKILFCDKLLLFLIILGILVQGFINFPSGFLYKEGLYFWSSQGHDGLWHVALMEEIKKSLPPQNPVFAGYPLYNYHYLVDVVMGEFGRIFPFFSSLDLYFRFFPVIFSFLIGMTAFAFVTRWQENKKIGYLAVFFSYFVGSFGYIVVYMRRGTIFGGETVFWAAQGNTIIGNPPHAMGYSLITVFFLSFLFFLNKRSPFWFLTSFLLAAFLVGFKVSAGFVLLVGVGLAALVDILFNRRFSAAVLGFLLGLSNLLTFKLMTKGGSSLLMFLPWWFIRTMIVSGDRLDWVDLELKRQHYLSKGTWHAWLRVIQLEVMAFFIFLIGNLGMRVLGFVEIFRLFLQKKKSFCKNPLEIAVFTTMVIAFLIPIFFVQRGIIYNNIQFMQYFLLLSGFYAAIATYRLISFFKNTPARVFIVILLTALSIPTVIGNFVEFYAPPKRPLAKVTNPELDALSYLKTHSDPEAIILTKPFDEQQGKPFVDSPRPIYFWYNTAFVSALSSRRSFLADEEQVLITNYPRDDRLKQVKEFFQQDDFAWNRDFLKKERISYIYLSKKEINKPINNQKNNLETFFENNETIIYKVLD